jgi:hypothetical protein
MAVTGASHDALPIPREEHAMAVCADCRQEMRTAASCTADVLILVDERFERPRARRVYGPDGRCGDCGIRAGGYHHLGCEMERCPRCRRQLLSCGCADVDDHTVFVCAVADGVVVHPASLRGLRVPSTQYPFRELVAGGPP